MYNLYLQLESNKKISVYQSMIVMSKQFLSSYDWDLTSFKNDEELLNDLYFYWLRMSAIREYVWCKEYNDFFLSHEFADEMKARLKSILLKSLMLKRGTKKKNVDEKCLMTTQG